MSAFFDFYIYGTTISKGLETYFFYSFTALDAMFRFPLNGLEFNDGLGFYYSYSFDIY